MSLILSDMRRGAGLEGVLPIAAGNAGLISSLSLSGSFFAEPFIKRKSFSSGEKSFFMLYYLVSDCFQYRRFVYHPSFFHYGELQRIVAQHRYLPGVGHCVLIYEPYRSFGKKALRPVISGLMEAEFYHILSLFLIQRIYYIFQGNPVKKILYLLYLRHNLHLRQYHQLKQFIFVRLVIKQDPHYLH